MKEVVAVEPYIYKGQINFKHKPYDAWKEMGGKTAASHYPIRLLHKLAFSFDFPTLSSFVSKREARLRFVQPWSISFDTYPDYMFYEIIPVIWDCWPENIEKTIKWLQKHKVRTAFFTSSQVADLVKAKFPSMNVLCITEGIDIDSYKPGKDLKDRKIDFLEYGREIDRVVKYNTPDSFNYFHGKKDGKILLTQQQLYDTLADSKDDGRLPKVMDKSRKCTRHRDINPTLQGMYVVPLHNGRPCPKGTCRIARIQSCDRNRQICP